MKHNEEILFYAFRYALGRRSYAVGMVSDEIIKQWHKLDKHTRFLIQKEIKEAIEADIADAKYWQRILNLKV